jgi:phosphoglycolate phosphatase
MFFPALLPFKVLVFDFDYTLFDSSAGVVRCMRAAIESLGVSTPSDNTIRRTIGLPLRTEIAALLGEGANNERIAYAESVFLAQAALYMVEETKPLPYAIDTIQALAAAGIRMSILTGKYRDRVVRTLTRHSLMAHFDHLVCGDDAFPAKPDPRALHWLALQYRCAPIELGVVGDHPIDIAMAQRAGAYAIGVASGFHSAPELAALGPYYVIENLSQLDSVPRQEERT